jgi:hypothetical protein
MIIVTVSEDDLLRVFGLLKLDFRKQGVHGRIINTRRHVHVKDVDSNVMVRLQHGDKLMAWGSVQDIHNSAEQVCQAALGPPFNLRSSSGENMPLYLSHLKRNCFRFQE